MQQRTIIGETLTGERHEMPLESIAWRPGAYAIIRNEAGQLLVLQNLLSGKLEIPGGGIEIWEDIPSALVREVWEETGLEVRVGEVAGVADRFFISPSGKHWHTINLVYHATVLGGALRNTIIPDELSMNPHWISLSPADLPRFQACGEVLRQVFGF